VIVIDLKGRHRGWWGILQFYRRLSGYHFDKVIDFQNNQKSHLLGWLSMAAHTYGYHNKKWGWLLTDPVKNPNHDLPPVAHQFQVLSLLGISYDPQLRLELYPTAQDRAQAARMMEEEWIGEGMKVVGINLSASVKWKTKNWSLEKIARLCDLLAARNIRVAITGAPKDRPLAEDVISNTKAKPANFVGKTSIMELAALIERCQVYITPDSSPMHIAAAMKTPFVAFFGPTAARRHLPPNDCCVAIEKDLDCIPCYNGSFCRVLTHACMKNISVEEVLAAIERLMETA